MRHPDSESTRWGPIWFAKYGLIFGIPLLALVILFHDSWKWFVGLSLYWLCATALFAWRAVNAQVGLGWRVALGVVILASWGYATLMVVAGPGDTVICYDRIRQTAFRGPMINMGPDPNCKGVALDAVETGG